MTDNLTESTINPALLNRDYTLLVDRSGSMGEFSAGTKKTRWQTAEEGACAVARKINELDPDGITVYTFANHFKREDNVGPDQVKKIFASQEPNGGTNLAGTLTDAFENYFNRKKAGKAQPNGESFLVVTDGLPDDEAAVVAAIKNATTRIASAKEMAVTFIQVGNDKHARDYLKRLDDDLESEGAKYDIVDVITMDDIGDKSLAQVLTDAITEHKQH